jgi:hypothetical protein
LITLFGGAMLAGTTCFGFLVSLEISDSWATAAAVGFGAGVLIGLVGIVLVIIRILRPAASEGPPKPPTSPLPPGVRM